LLLNALQQFITAFGQELDGDPRLAFIQVGLLGFWGEWHTYPHSDWIPATTKDSVIQWLDNAFSTTLLQNRYPWPAAVTAGFGLFDDSFAFATLTDTTDWFFWPQVERAGYTNFWQQNAMGGEVYPPLQDEAFLEGFPTEGAEYEQDFDLCADTTHATYMLNNYAFSTGYTEATGLARAQASASRLGYQFIVTQVSASSVTGDNSVVDMEVEITQTGVAPFYYPLSLSLTCSSGQWEATGVEAIVGQGDAKAFGFSGITATQACLGSMVLSFTSSYAYDGNPVKFAQGTGAIEVSFGVPPS
jgi:type II secretory pathway pseudopilin PulG